MALSRRSLLALPALAAAAPPKARVAITFDLEMSRNFPRWEETHWDYEKGNLDDAARRYSVAAARRVAEHGGRLHFFVLGRTFEQDDVGWLEEIARAGHPIGNHTYDHVNLRAATRAEIQPRFARAPWLIEGRTIPQVLEDNIRATTAAMRTRLGIAPAGFRTPGGFAEGLAGRADLQRMLQSLGFTWASARYSRHPAGTPGRPPDDVTLAAIRRVLPESRPFRYPETGLLEIPMSPVSDIGAFRNARWDLDTFLRVVRTCLEDVIEAGGYYDFLAHPSCIGVVDPYLRSIDLICRMVNESRGRAELVTLDQVARAVEV